MRIKKKGYASILDGFLTDECAKCKYWMDGTSGGFGCGCTFPIFECEAFSRLSDMYDRRDRDRAFRTKMFKRKFNKKGGGRQ